MPTSAEPVVVCRGLVKTFGDTCVLDGVDLSVRQGEVVVVLGRSGSGKSTLLRCLNHLETPTAGEVRVAGVDLPIGRSLMRRDRRTIRLARERVGMVFQDFNLFPHRTVLDNVSEALVQVKGVPKPQARRLALAQLERVAMSEKADEHPIRCSGGQKQRVAIARALAMEPALMLFDEPTSALDPELVGEVLQVMRQVALAGMTMLVVTHEIRFARDVADRIILIDRGRIVEEGPPSQVLDDPRTPEAQGFLRSLSPTLTGPPTSAPAADLTKASP